VPEGPTQDYKISAARYVADIARCAMSETLGFWRKSSSESLIGAVILAAVPLIGLGEYLYFSRGFGVFVEWITALGVGVLTLAVFLLLLFAIGFVKAPLALQRRSLAEIATLKNDLATVSHDNAEASKPRLVAKDFRTETRIWEYPVREGSKIEGTRQHYDSCLLLRIENDPIGHAESCVVTRVAGNLEFRHEGGETKRFPVRWISVGAPADRPPSSFDDVADFGIGTYREVLIAFKRKAGDPRCYAVTDAGIHNGNANHSLADHAGGLPPGRIAVTLRIRAVAIDLEWRLEFTNPEETTKGGWELSTDGVTPIDRTIQPVTPRTE